MPFLLEKKNKVEMSVMKNVFIGMVFFLMQQYAL